MKVVIQEVSSTDVEDLVNWHPSQLEDIYFPLGLILGTEGTRRGDLFYVLVASPEALRSRTYLGKCFLNRHLLIVREYDWPAILAEVHQVIEACESTTWLETAHKLSRWFHWEFEYSQANPTKTY